MKGLLELKERKEALEVQLREVREELEKLVAQRERSTDPAEIEELLAREAEFCRKKEAISSALAALEREVEEEERERAERNAKHWRENLLPQYHEEMKALEEEVFQALEEARARYDALRKAEAAWIEKWGSLGRPSPRPKAYSGRGFRDFVEPPPAGFGERERRLRRIWRA